MLRYAFSDAISQNFQSDRPYSPSLTLRWRGTFWLAPRDGVQRFDERIFGLGNEAPRPFVAVHTERATYAVRDTALIPFPGGHALSVRSRPLDAWTMLRDWRIASEARVVDRCTYREWPRVVLARLRLRARGRGTSGYAVPEEVTNAESSGRAASRDRHPRAHQRPEPA